jgi:hypothetical protein
MAEQDDIRVFFSSRDTVCDDCNGSIERGELIAFTDARETLCLSCADLDHLIYLPAGSAALTRRSKKLSKLSAVVYRWNKARKRNERKGILVEDKALRRAEKECLADEDVRIQRRARDAKRREIQDRAYIKTFIDAILDLYPGCPSNTAKSIAEHACLKYSGRVGRSAAAKKFDDSAVRLAVVAHVRHAETKYDELLMEGWERFDARSMVKDQLNSVLSKWRKH